MRLIKGVPWIPTPPNKNAQSKKAKREMKKITLILGLLTSVQAFGWRITFDDQTTFNKTYEILTFEKESNYTGMIKQISLGSSLIGFLGVVAPVAGKLGDYKVGQLKKTDKDKDKESSTTLVLASELSPQKYDRTYSEAEIELIKLAVKAASKGLEKLVKSGVLGDFFTKITKEGYTIDYIKSFRPGAGVNFVCRDATSLAKHTIHPIKSNKEIFFVILDKETSSPLYANWGPAYGEFFFRLVDIKAQQADEEITIGDIQLISKGGATSCVIKP